MEAEYTDLTDELGNARNFNGYSNNYSGTGAILADENCSNGKYVQAGNQPNRYLIFEIKSEVAVSDAYLTINASMDYGYSIAEKNTHDGDQIGSVSVSSEQFQIRVFSESDLEDDMDPQEYTGGTVLSFDTLTFDVSSLTEINTHCAFKTYNISNISLVAGTNYIVLTTTSAAAATSAGGQMTAKSPNLDCITIYSSDASALSQKKYQS